MTPPTSSSLDRRTVIGLALGSLLVAACGSGDDAVSDTASDGDSTAGGVQVVSPERAAEVIEQDSDRLFVLDVRTPAEFDDARIEGAQLIDIQQADFESRIDALDRDDQYVLYCRSGNRSERARLLMAELDFREVYDVDGGILAWMDAGLPVVSS